jgi:hypothetical protein
MAQIQQGYHILIIAKYFDLLLPLPLLLLFLIYYHNKKKIAFIIALFF